MLVDGYFEVSVVASSETQEALGDLLFSVGALGLVTDDGHGEPPRMTIRASFPASVSIGPLIERLRWYQNSLTALGLSGANGPIEVREIPVEDWGRNWKLHFKPLRVGRRLVVAPPWEGGPFPEGRVLIRIDPAMAFGTGHHATTRMCLEGLEAAADQWPDRRGPIILDVGTGTGILAIAAASLGARRVVAIDTDPEACDAARKNLAMHDCGGRVQLLCGGIESLDPRRRFDLILANLDTRTLCPLFPALGHLLAPRGRMIAGGMPVEDEETVTTALPPSLLRILHRRVEEEWLCLTLGSD